MSTTVSKRSRTTATSDTTSADRLRHSFSAMRVSFCWLGTRKSLSNDQRQQAADQFGAEQKFISAGKKLIDTSHPAMLAVNQLRRQITEYWKGCSLPLLIRLRLAIRWAAFDFAAATDRSPQPMAARPSRPVVLDCPSMKSWYLPRC